MRGVKPIASNWDSRRITKLFKQISSSKSKYDEAIKSADNSYCLKPKSILKTSDLSLSQLAEIDPDVKGNGSFRIFSKSLIKKRTI